MKSWILFLDSRGERCPLEKIVSVTWPGEDEVSQAQARSPKVSQDRFFRHGGGSTVDTVIQLPNLEGWKKSNHANRLGKFPDFPLHSSWFGLVI